MSESPAPAPAPVQRVFNGSFWFLAGFVAVTGGACYLLKGPEVFWASLAEHAWLLLAILPVIGGAILLGAFAQVLVPPAVVRKRLGHGSGLQGLLLAVGMGVLIPGGPMISMPLLMAVIGAGADLAACVAFHLSWSLLALARVIQWELPLMGPRFAIIRYLATVPLPLLGGVIAAWIMRRRARSRET